MALFPPPEKKGPEDKPRLTRVLFGLLTGCAVLWVFRQAGAAALYYAKVPNPFTVDPGEVALFEKGSFKISMTNTDVDIT